MVNVIDEKLCVEAETLKDILWYIRGSINQADLGNSICEFNNDHVESLEVAIRVLNKEMKSQRKTTNETLINQNS